jgi:S-adenosylmethionine decarboxylase
MNPLLANGWEAFGLLLTGSVVFLGALWSLSAAGTRPQAREQEPAGDNPHRRGRDPDKKAGRPAPMPNADDAEDFAFQGRHLIASYTGCSLSAMRDVQGLTDALHAAVAASGATLLQSVRHIFPPHGMTAVVLLSESHASIHTYPEHSSCFVDIFTCGSSCQVEAFDAVLRGFLRPQRATRRIIERHEEMVDEASANIEAA